MSEAMAKAFRNLELRYQHLEAEAQALREEVEALKEKLEVAKTDELNAAVYVVTESLRHELWDSQREVAALRARVVVAPEWKPLTGPGQIKKGDLLRFAVSGKEIEAPAQLIINEDTGKEEIVYNRGKNHYFITSMVVDGTSSHKGVMVKRLNGKAVSEGLLRGLVAFALELVRGAGEGGSFDGCEIQESAEQHGLLTKQVMSKPCCGPDDGYCSCAYEVGFPTECYQVNPDLNALLGEGKEHE